MNESRLKSSVMFRMFVMACVALLLLILASFVESLISERKRRSAEAINEVSQKWGGIQTITGPVLTLPFRKLLRNEKGETRFSLDYLHIMPETLRADIELNPEIRYRGIYEVILYQALVSLKGTFILSKLKELDVSPEDLLLRNAFLTVGITDLRGIKNTITLNWDGAKLPASPGTKLSNIVKAGFTVVSSLDISKNEYVFSVDLRLNGSKELSIAPVGKETLVVMSSRWKSPSFTGSFLPEKREITSEGFRAEWTVQQLNRSFPQVWKGCTYPTDNSAFGVRLHLPVDEYQKVTRAVKYAIMFIALTRRPGHVFSRDQLMDLCWDEPDTSLDRTIDAHIKNIRSKLRSVNPDFDPIITHRGMGYSLKEEL